MSRIGKQPIPVPSGVEVKIDGTNVRVKGPKGELTHDAPASITVAREGDDLVVTRPDDVTAQLGATERHETARLLGRPHLPGAVGHDLEDRKSVRSVSGRRLCSARMYRGPAAATRRKRAAAALDEEFAARVSRPKRRSRARGQPTRPEQTCRPLSIYLLDLMRRGAVYCHAFFTTMPTHSSSTRSHATVPRANARTTSSRSST